jgi:alkanesulfonate monooxygenase SsuD/methylene tetrahydromethanopterin reductase-like flavin-dependent oxidoreductase (luciferase family)
VVTAQGDEVHAGVDLAGARRRGLERPLNVPGPLRRPPILIGGAGEHKTLRLVAQYAGACNLRH